MSGEKRFDLVSLCLPVAMVCLAIMTICGVSVRAYDAAKYRENAMDLFAWHARAMNPDNNVFWWRVKNGQAVCPFCGQKHDDNWVSRNAWDSQINAAMQKVKSGEAETAR